MASALETLAKRESWQLIRRLLLENASDKWPSYAAGFGLLFVVSAMTGLTAYVMEDVINEIFVNQRRDMTFVIAGAVAAIFILKGAASYGNAIILARAGNAIVARLQRRMFDALLKQNLAYYEHVQLGNMLVKFQNGVSGAREAINTLILSIGRDVFSLISLVAVMIVQDPVMSLISLTIGPPAVIGVMHLMRKVKGVAKAEFHSMGQLLNVVKETFLGVKVVKTYRLEGHMREQFSDAVSAVERVVNGMARLGALTVPMMEALGGIAVAAAIIYGGLRVIDGGAEPGSFFSFITALLLAYEPARRLARFNVQFQQSMIGVAMVYQILDLVESPTESNDGPDLEVKEGRIELRNVTFAYNSGDTGEDAVLKDMTLEFPAGQVTALVGPSGGGKSTIFSLIARLRRPLRGRILIDGTPISKVSARSLRAAVAYVTQDPFLFDATIRENIRMGRPEATDAEVEAAADKAFAHEFILEQNDGYDTRVGEGGGRLSGGQRQRIAIARAMLADAPIILLDEATSALDSVSEMKVQAALEKLMQGRTTIVIAHRLSTVRNAAVIHVIERGRCVESGSHEELIARRGLYKHLYDIQFRDAPQTADV